MSLWSKYRTKPENQEELEAMKRKTAEQEDEANWLFDLARGAGNTFRHSRKRNNYGLIASDIIRGKREGK